jgi:hypothetical protein
MTKTIQPAPIRTTPGFRTVTTLEHGIAVTRTAWTERAFYRMLVQYISTKTPVLHITTKELQ